MSWKALTWASEQKCRTSAEKFVLVMLANHADEQNTCYPGVESLAEETQLGASTVRRCITHLAVDGKIRVLQRWGARGSRRSNRYQLLTLGADTPLPEHGDWQREYEYKPKPSEIDSDGSPVPGETIPLGSSGMSDQGLHTAQSERYAGSDDGIPLGSSGINRSDRAVTFIRNESSVVTPTPYPHDGSGEAPAAVAETTEEGEEIDELAERLAAVADAVRERRPGWARSKVLAAVRAAVADGRDLEVVLAAVPLVAADPATVSPGRLNGDGPWWTEAEKAVRKSPRPVRMVFCDEHVVKHPQGEECPRCTEEGRKSAQRGSGGAAGGSEINPEVLAGMSPAIRARVEATLARVSR